MSIPSPELQQKYAPPLNQNWTRRAYHSSVVVGDWVYIHMGEVAVGTVPYANPVDDPDYHKLAVNATLSLNIGSSWTDPSTLAFQAFPRTNTSVYNHGVLWYDKQRNEAFTFGGELSDGDGDDKPSLFTDKLIPTSDGYGSWATNSTGKEPPFSGSGLTRPIGGVTAQSNTTAFWLGGYSTNMTSPKTESLKSYQPTPNLVTYDFATGAWGNTTLDRTLPLGMANGTIEWGGMEFLPTLGPNGMLVIWGGETSNTSVYVPGESMRLMTNIALHDPSTKRWFTQQIDGVAPSLRSRFCSVSASDPRPVSNNTGGTHEIFMYGGYAGTAGPGAQQYDEVWALSIPSFTWHQLDASHTSARSGHTCHAVGNRQMLSIGGVDSGSKDPWDAPDYYNLNGVGVFDLTKATWADGFDADADDYQRADIIGDAITRSGAFPKTWTMQSLASLVINKNPSDQSDAPLTGLPPNSNASIYTSGSSKPSHVGIIAAGTIGGLVAVFLPILILYLYFYHYRPQHTTMTGKKGSKRVFELAGNFSWPKELPAQISSLIQRRRKERQERRGPGLSTNQTRHELEAGEVAGELAMPSPTVLAPTNTVTISGGYSEGQRFGITDYFSFLKPSRPRTPQPVMVTPNVKEVPTTITPKGSCEGGRPQTHSIIPSIPRFSAIFLRPPSFLQQTSTSQEGVRRPENVHRSETRLSYAAKGKPLPSSPARTSVRSARASRIPTSDTVHELEGDSMSPTQASDSESTSPFFVSPQSTELPFERFKRSVQKASSPESFVNGLSPRQKDWGSRNRREHLDDSNGSDSSALPFSPLSQHTSDDDDGEKEKSSPDSTFFKDDEV